MSMLTGPIKNKISLGVSIPGIWILVSIGLIHVAFGNGICSNSSMTNWKDTTEKFPKLVEFFETRIGDRLEEGSRTLQLVSWQDKVLRLTCLDTEEDENVREWKHRYFPGNKKTAEEEKDFSKAKYDSQQMIGPILFESEYFSVYSCLTRQNCWHHFFVVSQPFPKVTTPVYAKTGADVNISCEARPRFSEDGDEELQVNMPLQSIKWRYPDGKRPENVQEVPTNKTIDGVTTFWDSTLVIKDASDANRGIHECILVDKFGVTSSPSKLDGRHLANGEVYQGSVNVHVRPMSYTLIPLGIIGIQLLLIPLLVRFCPTAKGEADLEEEDDPKKPRQKLDSSGDRNDVDT